MQPKFPETKVEQVDTGVNTPTFNAAEAAKSPYGNLEVTKYLYESGLQNIFNTYQQNVANLSQQKQQELQDAYYIREMSKKYLGEYASNVGIGDVSGNLLDIYGQYQSNLTDIERNYDQLQMGLDQQFQQQRQETMNNLLLTEYNIEVAKLAEADRKVLFDIEMGNIPEGVTDMEYLQQQYEAGNISQEAYQQASMNLMENQRTAEERAVWGQIVRGELSKEELTAAYEAGTISVEAYNQYFSAMEQQERSDVLYNVQYDILQRNFGETENVEDFLQAKLDDGTITQNEYQDLMLQYGTDQYTSYVSDVEFAIAMNEIPEGFDNAQAYIQAEYDAGRLDKEDYQRLSLIEEAKARSVEAGTLVQNIITNNLPEGQNAYDAIQEGMANGLIDAATATELIQQVFARERSQNAATIEFNIYSGEIPDGLTAEAYIEREYAAGNITEADYQGLKVVQIEKKKAADRASYLANLYGGEYGGMTREEFIQYGFDEGFIGEESLTSLLIEGVQEEQISMFNCALQSALESNNVDATLSSFVGAGTITQEEADAIQAQVYAQNEQQIFENINKYLNEDESYSFGFDENGDVILSVEGYIEANKDNMSTATYNLLTQQIKEREERAKAEENIVYDVTSAINNPYYNVNLQNTDFSMFTDNELVGENSKLLYFQVGTDTEPTAFVTSGQDIDTQNQDLTGATVETSDSILEKVEADGQQLRVGGVYQGKYSDKYYYYDGTNFYEMLENVIDPQALTPSEMQNWIANDSGGSKTGFLGMGTERWDTFTFNGVIYQETSGGFDETKQNKTQQEQSISELFTAVHGDKRTVVVFYQGSFYVKDKNGQISKMEKK